MRLFKPWERVNCDQCGMEFTAARSREVPRDDDVELLCPECAAWWRGYEDAQQEIELERLGRELAAAGAAQVTESISAVGEAAPRIIHAYAQAALRFGRAIHASELEGAQWKQAFFDEQSKHTSERERLSTRIEHLQRELAERNAELEQWCGR